MFLKNIYLHKYHRQMNPKYFLNTRAPCTLSTVFQRAINRVTNSINIRWWSMATACLVFFIFLSLVLGGQKQKHEGAGSQEGNSRQPDIKMVQESSRTSQVAAGQTKREKEEARSGSFLKANGLSMVVLYYIQYYKICADGAISHWLPVI